MEVDWERRGQLIEERRLDPRDVEAIIEDLQGRGLGLKEADYRNVSFGSWCFVICGDSVCVRVSFDGRDGFLSFDRWGEPTEYQTGDADGGWENVFVYNPDVTDEEHYTATHIVDQTLEIASGP